MTDIFGIGTSALAAFQRALETVGHNVANVATPGYSRQQVEFATRKPEFIGVGFQGTGVEVGTVRRAYDEYATGNLRAQLSGMHEQQTLSGLAERLDGLLGDADAGLSKPLQEFFSGMLALSNDPTSGALRQAALGDAESLVARFNGMAQELSQSRLEVDAGIHTAVAEVNGITATIAGLNRQIAAWTGSTSGPPNDLLDQRDLAIEALSRKLAVNTVAQDDGSLTVFTTTGQVLVIGPQASTLSAVPQLQDPQALDVALVSASATVRITQQVRGGELGGLLTYRDQVLAPAENALGRVAVATGTLFNEQHRSGMDLDGALGGEFFAVGSPQVIGDARNQGSGSVAVDFDDATALGTDDYRLRFSAGTWQLSREADGQSVAFESGSGTAAEPFIVEGLAITVDPAAVDGDSYLVRPTRSSAAHIGLAISDPRAIAAAGALAAQAATGNAGDGEISAARIVDGSDANLLNTANIVFDNPPTTYSVDGGASQAYTAGADITVNGWQVRISGQPQAGDSFTVHANTGGVGDNRNALALAGLQSQLTLAGGSMSLGGAYSALVADVGIQTRRAQNDAQALEAAVQQAQTRRDSISGVNLDEEAAKLVQFQQAYQAAARVITTAEAMFQSLLDAVRR